jgi:hypothetical protein
MMRDALPVVEEWFGVEEVVDEDLRWLFTGDVVYDGPIFDVRSRHRVVRRDDAAAARARRGSRSTRTRPASFDGDRLGEIVEGYLTLRAPH